MHVFLLFMRMSASLMELICDSLFLSKIDCNIGWIVKELRLCTCMKKRILWCYISSARMWNHWRHIALINNSYVTLLSSGTPLYITDFIFVALEIRLFNFLKQIGNILSTIYYLRSITTFFGNHMSSLEKYVGPSNYIISFFIKLTINSSLMYFIISLNKIYGIA